MDAALILIDIQKGFDDYAHWGGSRNNPDREKNAKRLLDHWREKGWPVVHIHHDSLEENSPLRAGQAGNDFKDGFEPQDGEAVFGKNVNSAFIGTGLKNWLDERGLRDLVICGISTEHCVSTTTRMAGNFGYQVRLVGDACHAWPYGEFDAETIHKTQLAVLNGEFAKVVKVDEIG